MAIDATIPNPQTDGVVPYSTQDPTGGGSPGIIVPPSVLPVLMKTSTALTTKPSAPPPHPQVGQPLTAIPLGYQMAFNQLMSPTPYGNAIVAYRIYRNKSANNFSGSQLIRTIIHDPTHQGAVTVQDSTGGNVNYFYFVTAVDSTGQESNQPGAFQASATPSGAANPNVANAIGVTSGPTTTSGTYAVIPEMTITITTKGNKVLILFSGTIVSATGSEGVVAVFRDGVQVSPENRWGIAAGASALVTISYIDSPSAASHTYDIRWKNATTGSGQTLTATGILRSMQAVELG